MSRQKLRKIIEDLSASYNVNSMDCDDFYRAIIGIYGKEGHPLSLFEFEEHRKALWDAGVWAGPSYCGDAFLMYNQNLPHGKNMRFYLNAHDAENARKIIVLAVNRLEGKRFRIKTIGYNNYGYGRYDNTVLYVNAKDDVKYVANILQELSNENKELFDSDIPFTTKKIAKGIGYGTSVGVGPYDILGRRIGRSYSKFSFNTLQGLVLSRLFNKFQKRDCDLDEKTELYAQALEQAGFDPENMHLTLGLEDPLKDFFL